MTYAKWAHERKAEAWFRRKRMEAQELALDEVPPHDREEAFFDGCEVIDDVRRALADVVETVRAVEGVGG